MKFEFSAGGIVFRRDKNKKVEVLIAQHSQHHGWVFPKGLIGDHPSPPTHSGLSSGHSDSEESSDSKRSKSGGSGQVRETKEGAAVREVKEETGIDAKIVQALDPVTYWYKWEGETRKKTVYYYIMEYVGGDFSESDEEMENIEWLPIDQVLTRLTYKSDKEVFEKAKPIIERLVGD